MTHEKHQKPKNTKKDALNKLKSSYKKIKESAKIMELRENIKKQKP